MKLFKGDPLLCRLGLHTKPKNVHGLIPPIFCTKCDKVLEPNLRTDIRFKINIILVSVVLIVIGTVFIIGLLEGFWRF
jgi:hypothetical protein